jgi:aquaporin NIP
MNPARSLGPAIVAARYGGLWVYVVGPVCGTVAGAWAYNLIRLQDKPITRSSFLNTALGLN